MAQVERGRQEGKPAADAERESAVQADRQELASGRGSPCPQETDNGEVSRGGQAVWVPFMERDFPSGHHLSSSIFARYL